MDTVKRVIELSEGRGMSLYKLAEHSGVPYSTLRSAQRRNGQLQLETILQICRSLNILLSEFFAETAGEFPTSHPTGDS